MENGVETIDISHVVEKKLLEDGVSEERVEEGVVAESPQLKDLEDEDVFEEAVDIPEDLLEERSKSDLQADMIDEDVKGKTNGDSEFGDAVENSSVDYKFEEAEGAIEATSEVRKSEEGEPLVDAEKEEDGMVVEKLIDVPNVSDETGNEEEVIPNESGKLRDDGLVSSSKDVEEVPVISPTIENEVVKRGDQFDLYSDEVINKAENEDSNNVNVELFHADEEVENEQAVTAVEEGNLHSHQGIETNTVIFNGSANHMELGENNLGVEEVMDEPINASANHLLEINDDKSAEPSDNITNGGTKHHDDESREIKDATAIPDLSIGNDEGEYLKYTSPSLNTEHLDHKIEEVKGTAIGLYPQNSEETFEMKDTSPDFHKSVDEGAVEMENGVSLSSSENINNEQTEKVQGSEAEENNNSQHQHSDNKVNNDTGTEELEKREKKDLEVKQSTHTNSAPTTQPAPEFASSSGKSTNSVPPSARPAGLGRAAPLLEPAPRAVQQPRANGTPSHMQTQQMEDSASGEAEENDETREKLQMIRVKFLRLAHRLGQTPHNVVVAQVLYRLGLAEQLRGRNGGRVGAFSFDRASAMAEQLEAAGQEPLDFTCTIMVLGKTGVGKSATINSIFDEVKFNTDAFQMGTKKVQDIVGTVQGIKVRVIDTPGLLPSWSDQRQNEKILLSVKRFIKKTPPDIVLYLDRLDMQSRDFSDMPLLRTITDIFGPSIWFNAIVVLTHAASAPPDGPNGTASGYDMFVTQRSHVVQQAIRQAAGDMRLMNPVSLVENHSACRTNRAGQRVLPNGQVWKPHLLLLSFASKILAEANALLKLQDSPPGRPFATRSRAPPLPFLLSSLLQSRPQAKLPEDQFGDEDGLEDDLDESSDSEDESEFDELPPFKRLTKAQVAKLSKAQKRAYFDELEYREKLFMKKQLKEDRRRRRMMKKMAAEAKNMPSDFSENVEEETGGAASVPVPMPDLALPASFDSDNPTHRYRYLDSSNQWLIRPVLETHGWDHDVGYEGINVERLFVVKDKIPISFSGQVSKDKKDANVQMEMTSSVKHGEGKATSLGFDMQTVGKDLAYTLRSETVFSNFRKNKATAGLSVTLLGDALSAGVKIEDKLVANKRFRVVVTGGAMSGRGDIAYGGSLEAQLRDKDYPLGRSLSTLGLSVMDWHGDLAIGCNIQSQIPVGQSTNLIGRANLNNRGAGQISIRLNSSEQLQIALIGLIPLARKLLGYPQQLQFGQ